MYFGQTLKELRQRKGWQQERLLDELSYYMPVLHRLEKGDQLPRDDSILHVLDALNAPMDELICPHLENQPMDAYILCHNLAQALDSRDLEQAQSLYDEISAIEGFEYDAVNRQLLYSHKARILEQQGKTVDEIMLLVISGIKETFEDFDEKSPGKNVLLFEEPELFHTLARLYARKGQLSDAIRILKETKDGLQRFPTGERERDKRFTPIMLSLADCQLETGAYEDAIDTCDLGFHTSVIRTVGESAPDFIFKKVQALTSLNRYQECSPLIKLAYAGYMLLGEKEKAEHVLTIAQNELGISINTYGMDKLDIPPVKRIPYARGAVPACKSIGEMINVLRRAAKISLKELSQGICSIANLSKIESNTIKGHVHHIEPILQRLGRDPLLYCNFFLRKDDFKARELRDLIHLHLVTGKNDDAATALDELKKYDSYKEKANLQFIRRIEALLFGVDNGMQHPQMEQILLDALKLTWPDFDEEDINHKPLTLDESVLINCLAIHCSTIGNLKRASKIYEALIYNMNKRYVDEYEKARMYSSVMFNYSTCLGKLDRRRDALEIIEEAEEFERKRGALTPLPLLIANKAYNLYERSEKEKSLAYFAMAHYGFMMFEDYGRAINIPISQRLIMERFGFEIF